MDGPFFMGCCTASSKLFIITSDIEDKDLQGISSHNNGDPSLHIRTAINSYHTQGA